ncbi:hypothetical protein ABFS82_06G026100 [Erythranthe guttata]|uniref:F-box domain-containing protein n=2 Tax=Erythranthe guttata TaxID=4155 RepID=A0A022QB26_ERYGU|nr:PREDICTED: F-box protein At5g52880 isoform X1 [Erythranthe guttata]EYU25171.1 hypothetical protein MIMGU_mgv1a010888mg [Erythranthe guttata]|eukprot:XP_012852133.1 PREDICTED: F-box protein At5g52880 isoform X1 [Erythranthe guttata]
MGAQYLETKDEPIENYRILKVKESLSKPFQYVLACKELSFLLKNGYSQFPKYLQSLLFHDTVFAFTLLPEMPTQSAISAANSLLQSAEYALPKQKRAIAVKEYKHAIVASKRKSRTNQHDEDLTLPPQDVLVHIFSFLDVQSLASASEVCRSWNSAACENHLWKSLYVIYFSNSDVVTKGGGVKNHRVTKNEDNSGIGIDWRRAFKSSYKETCRRKFKSHRGCCYRCRSIVWISSNQCCNKLDLKDGSRHQIKLLSAPQIVDYIFGGMPVQESSSDSDSDIEDDSFLKLWAFPRQISG